MSFGKENVNQGVNEMQRGHSNSMMPSARTKRRISLERYSQLRSLKRIETDTESMDNTQKIIN